MVTITPNRFETNLYDFTFLSQKDDLTIHGMYMLPDPEDFPQPRAIVQLVHGMCEHKERYLPFMEKLAFNGYVSVIHDNRGHGASVKSTGDLGYFYTGGYNSMIDEVGIVNKFIRDQFPNLKLLLFGHSMGSLLVRSFVKRHDDLVDALVVCGSPAYNTHLQRGLFWADFIAAFLGDRYRSKLIHHFSFAPFSEKFKGEPSKNAWICSNPAVVKKYDKDPLCNFRFTINGFKNLFLLMQYTYNVEGWKLSNLQIPVFFIAGEDDPCIISRKKFYEAVEFMRALGYHKISFRLFKSLRHEILNEKDNQKVIDSILGLLNNI